MPTHPRDVPRHQPHPSFLTLPAFAWRRIPPVARVALVVLAVAAIAGAIYAAPRIAESKRIASVHEAAAMRALVARETIRVREEQAVRAGRVAPGAPRDIVVSGLTAAITRDANARIAHGRLPGPARVVETRCTTLTGSDRRLAQARGGDALRCLAATARAPDGSFAIGFEFLAAVDYRHANFTWCKTNPPPGEQEAFRQVAQVGLAPACTIPGASRKPPPQTKLPFR
jgi:hypothetical protein